QRIAFGDRRMQVVTVMADARDALTKRSPDILITSVDLPGGSGYAVVEMLRSGPAGELPFAAVLFSQESFPDKVEAIRCGADVVLGTAALDELAQRIDAYVEVAIKPPARILVVEDDPEQAAFNESVLRSGGSDVLVCSETQTYEQDLYTFLPDLIVMDILMPGIGGHDLARFTRQNKRFATTPIIFLTSQTDLQTRIQSARSGGDEHLVKPVSPGLLLATAASRIERSRQLQSMLERDGLTGLLTHSAFADRLRQAWLVRRRHPRPAVLAMLDIDEFKKVNDQFGHAVGDRVLYSIAALLKRRLRQTDSIGRYGGEEFAILLEDLSAVQAERLVDLLREEFSKTNHEVFGGEPFNVTFSCGLASLTAGDEDLESWKRMADEALYTSKRRGRNRVTTAGSRT
ncbi:MAG TPA: diguanylate cyclase, partial [Thermoanaerobaculia bacterium]|nr:diguanylate cyclase [Thermoanaerobaculia bacterium]